MGYKGFVIEGFGAGNIPINFNSLLPWIIRVKEEEIPVLISTQCIHGHEWALLYENGKKALRMGAIPTYDMLSETALVKLMWVCAITNDINKIRRLMLKNIAGEISSNASINKK
jgi:glutamyl-tRNA(Gln) amidotransferase subunit D